MAQIQVATNSQVTFSFHLTNTDFLPSVPPTLLKRIRVIPFESTWDKPQQKDQNKNESTVSTVTISKDVNYDDMPLLEEDIPSSEN